MLMKLVVINLFVGLLLTVLTSSLPLSQESPLYQLGHSSLYFEASLQSEDFQQKQKHFSINPSHVYESQPSVLIGIGDFQMGRGGWPDSGRKNLDVVTLMATQHDGQIIEVQAKIVGSVRKLKMTYMIYQPKLEQIGGIRFWSSMDGQPNAVISYISLAIEQEIIQNKQGENYLTHKYDSQGLQMVSQQPIWREAWAVAVLSTLVVSDGQMINLLDIQLADSKPKIDVRVIWWRQLKAMGMDLVYSLVLKMDSLGKKSRIQLYDETRFIFEGQPFKLDGSQIGEQFFFGLTNTDHYCQQIEFSQSFKLDDKVEITIQIAHKDDPSPSKCTLRYTILKLKPTPLSRNSTNQRMLWDWWNPTCSVGTYNTTNNWTELAITSNKLPGSRLLWGCWWWCTQACMPCPIGCSVCSAATSCGLPVTCSSCKSGFTKTSTGVCQGQTYCNCPSGLYPNVYTGTCQNCSTVIPNCLSCSTNFFIGTFCASCAPGYYQTYNGATSGYARGCALCSTKCTNCTSLTNCTKCASNLIVVNGACTCNTTQNLYYSTTQGNCTLCSSVITNCATCAQVGLTTTCTLCNTGFYVNTTSNTCLPCTTYCTSCTNSTCSACVSSTFTISGTNCVCASQYYLNTTSTPVTCVACSQLQPHCTTCTNTSGSVLCSVCASGYFPNPGVCTACIANCVSCSTTTTCNTCKTNFTYNSGTTSCECSSGYLPSGTTCVLCTDLITGCTSCNPSPIYCITCGAGFYNATVNAPTCTACLPQCATCTSPTSCGSCITGYSGPTCTCANCTNCVTATGVTGCATCANNTCLTSQVGSYYNSSTNATVLCPTQCTSCTSSTVCQTCNPPFIYVSPNCVCNYALGYYYDTVGPTCRLCSAIITNCTSCTGTATSTTCTACTSGSYVQSATLCTLCPSNCTQCSSGTNCTSCLDTFQSIGGVCKCDTASQYFLNTTSNTCQSCSVLINYCTVCQVNGSTSIGVGCVTCAFGYYNDGSDFCTLCPQTCISCTSASACTGCLNSYSLINGKCTCDASLQLFDSGGQCAPCYTFVNYCTACTGTTQITCSACVAGTYLNIPDNTTCIICGANCNSCDATGCLTCGLGFSSVGGICVFTNQCLNYTGADLNCAYCTPSNTSSSTLCLACQAGYYVVNQASCVACPSTCTTCSDFSVCVLCAPTFTLVDGSCTCDIQADQVLMGQSCVSCSSLIPNCKTCNSSVTPVECTQPLPTFYLSPNGSCMTCATGCLTCAQNGSCSACIDGYTFQPNTLSCTNSAGCTTTQFYNGTVCLSCPSTCSSCLDENSCLVCNDTYSLVNGACECDAAYGMFYSPENSQCNQCGNYNSTSLNILNYTQNCQSCVSVNNSVGFECAVCMEGFYVSLGQCYPCQAGCMECSGSSSCNLCQAPIYLLALNGSCVCNTVVNYFLNGSVCDLCVLQNCTICITINTCQSCDQGSFVNSTTKNCQPEICGNGVRQGVQECDDNNTNNDDGCSSYCQIEPYYVCTNLLEGQLSVCSSQKNKFQLQLAQQIVSCNQIKIKFKNVGTQSVSHCDISTLLQNYTLSNSSLESYSVQNQYLIYTFSFSQTIQNQTFNLIFNPTTLCLDNSADFPLFNITQNVNSNNNKPAIYYPGGSCSKLEGVQSLVSVIQYASYATLALSFPCKIVGLQLFGVLQLSYLTLGSMDNVNLLLQPLGQMGGVNGFSLNLGADKASRLLQTFTPQRINALDYKANFIRNCNVMFLIVFATMAVSFVLYVATCICKSCAPTLQRVAKRIIKEVLLTLILFNELNFAYSAGIHFKYAPTTDPLYLLGTLAAAGTLIIPVLMSIALMFSQEEGFGEFKDKLKPGCVQKAYFVVTILYRMGIGLYMSSANEDQLSTLLLLAFSIVFLLYNLVNLPFTKAYHNYRANICHFAQFVTLFVAMYYRSMKSTSSVEETSSIFGPVFFEYILILASVLASILVLFYEIYLFFKECCNKKSQSKLGQGQADAPNMSLNQLKDKEVNTIKVEHILETHQQEEKRIDSIGPFQEFED